MADERGVLVDFLRHLDEFDRRRAWAEAGYDSLWNYCLRVLHLREGPAGRRIGAMRVLRRFPQLADALRDGRLCLSTVTVIAPLLTEENLDDVVERAAYGTKAEVEHMVASAVPRAAPRDGVRRIAGAEAAAASPSPFDSASLRSRPTEEGGLFATATTTTTTTATPTPNPTATTNPNANPTSPTTARAPARPMLMPVAADTYSLRVTLDASLKADLDELTALLSHKVPNGDLAAVLREAVRCALEKHGKRKGARAPARTRPPEEPDAASSNTGMRPYIPAHLRRAVWKRDGGRCAWCTSDGRRCDSRWKLEIDHIVPVARGGTTTLSNLRLLCRTHNQLSADEVFGAEHMARFRSANSPATEPGTPTRVRVLIPG
jgi:hypothetical protein